VTPEITGESTARDDHSKFDINEINDYNDGMQTEAPT